MNTELLNILLIEDNSENAALIREMLAESAKEVFELYHADNLVTGLERLSVGGMDVILLSLHLAGSDGLKAYARVRAQAGELPIVALINLEDEQSASKLFENGIQDYLVKGQTNGRMLVFSIRYAMERMRAKRLLQKSETRFYKLIETMADAIIIVDAKGLVQFINPAGELLFNTTSAGFLGQPFGFPLVAEESTEIEFLSNREGPVIAEMRVVETEWEGRPAWLLSIRDITLRKELERSLEETGRQLKQSVIELESANKKILDNQKSLIENERLEVLLQMAASTAHELNQPLTVLLGNIGLLESFLDNPEELRECLNDIEDAGQKMSEIVKKVQTLRKYETKLYVDGLFIINLDHDMKILSVEDSDDDFEILINILEDNPRLSLIRARNINSALKRLERETVDLILLDHILPDGNGFSFLNRLRQNNMDIPVIIVTGQGNEIISSRLILEGAYDYIPKLLLTGDTGDVLKKSIANTLEKVSLESEIRHMHDKIQEMEIEDKLTGLYNRRHFQNVLKNEMERVKRYGHQLVLCMMDLDHFKKINDTYGHLGGDMVLIKIGAIMKKCFRETDVACRFGGEEFAVLMLNLNLEKAQCICDRFRKTVAEYQFRHEIHDFQVSISIGIAQYNSGKDKTRKYLIKRADDALYQAKEKGRNRVISNFI